MNKNYDKVPNIITGKDLDYLTDMFNWNYGALKKSNDCINKIQELEIQEVMKKATNTFYNNLNTVLSVLEQGGQSE